MAMFPGYWIAPDGQVYDVGVEHYSFIQERPQLFGFTPGEAASWRRDTDEPRIMLEALKRGFTRVRGRHFLTVFEFELFDRTTFDNIWAFLVDKGFWPEDRIELHEISKDRGWKATADSVLKREEAEQFVANPGYGLMPGRFGHKRYTR